MAQPDFPSAPINGQTYTAPSGLQYTYDGQVWTSSSTSQSWLWTDTGTALTPYVNTRYAQVGSRTTKGHFWSAATIASTYLTHNATLNAAESVWLQDDATQPSWLTRMNSAAGAGGDNFAIFRTPAGGSPATVLTLDNVGHLTVKAMACSIWNNSVSQPITANTWTTVNLGTMQNDSSGGTMPNVATNQIKVTAASWCLLFAWGTFSAPVTGYLSLTPQTFWNTMYNVAQGTVVGMALVAANTLIGLQVYTTAASTLSYAGLAVIALGGQ